MKAEIIAVGNEIITGNTINSNASEIARAMQKVGIMTYYHSAVGDYPEDIKGALKMALKRADVILFTGGLGPTEDDLTKETVSSYLGKELVLDEDTLEKIKEYFKTIKREMTSNNYKQALIPEGAYLLQNENGTAPGCIIPYHNQYIVLLPGPPKELIPMLQKGVLPYFKNISKEHYITLDTRLCGIGESLAVTKIAHLLGEFEHYSVAPYLGNDEIIIRTITHGNTEEEAKSYAENIKNNIYSCLEEYIVGYNNESLEDNLIRLLDKHNYTIATVESCTGGLLASTLVNCSGISKYFSEGIVTYSNEAKVKYAQVKEETLRQYGAVSKETAKELAEGIKKVSGAHIGLSTTGVAGPTGGTKEKPVGLVYIGIALPDNTYIYELNLAGTREAIRRRTVKNILYRLYTHLK